MGAACHSWSEEERECRGLLGRRSVDFVFDEGVQQMECSIDNSMSNR